MKEIQHIGDVVVHKLKQNYLRLENSKQYILTIKNIDPYDEDAYIKYWRRIKKYVVEGYWGTESQGYRYCPGSQFFYANFGLIEGTTQAKITTYMRPLIQDLEWEFAYEFLQAEGFSGFYGDDKITCDEMVLTYDKNKLPTDQREMQLFSRSGILKTYEHPKQYCRRLHKEPLGAPMFFNEARNVSISGSRGGGKSYYVALCKLLHAIVTDGALYYSEEDANYYKFADYKEALVDKRHPKVNVTLGSGDTDKSSELFSKLVANMNALAVNEEFGVWGKPGDDDYTPCPLFKVMAGSTKPGNKDNFWRHEYKVIANGKELTKGTESKIGHVSYSAMKGKGKGAQAGAGGRSKYVAYEEQGLMENLTEVMQSNNSVVAREGVQFGVQVGIGTSGNIDAVQEMMKAFTNPDDYYIQSHVDEWEGNEDTKIGFFLPFYMTLRQFKDEDGNTKYQEAFEHIYKLRKKASESSDPNVLRKEKMNRPIIPSEMWITQKGHYLPHAEAVERQKQLIGNKTYLNISTAVDLVWDSNYPNGIKHEVNMHAEPFYDFPLRPNMTSFDSSIVIYDYPKDHSPNDFYFATHDPYVSDNIDKGGSFGATHIIINPKYWDEYMPHTGPMVATYIAKPTQGLKNYYLEQEKLLAFYNSPIRGLAYEANRGANCKNYYFNKQKTHVLALRPQVFDRSSVFLNRTTEYGYVTTNVVEDLDRLNDLLLTYIPKLEKKFIETIPCLFTIKQIILFELKGNYDAVSSLMIAPKHIGVIEQERQGQAIEDRLKNELKFFSTNDYLKT